MRRPIAIHGASEEALALVPVLEENPELEIVGIYDPQPDEASARAERLGVAARIGSDPALFQRPLFAVIDAGGATPFARAFPDVANAGPQIVSPLTARLLWGYGVSTADRKAELLQALHEVVESVNLTVDADELASRMLEIAMGVTGADGGSLMLLDRERTELRVRVASGLEPELWEKIRVPLGDGVAGRVAADARPIKVRGPADRSEFRIVRERFDVESALCVPLIHEGTVLGVLNLHHGTRPDVFDDDDMAFAEQLGRLDAAIIARAQEHDRLKRQASRYEAVRAVRDSLGGADPLDARLDALCERVATQLGGGVATIFLHHAADEELRLAATSLPGGGLGGDYRVAIGTGLDGQVAQRRQPSFLDAPGGGLAVASLPLQAGQELVGVLSVQVGPGAQDANRALRETLLEMAAAVAEEIAHAEREARITARATKASAVNEAGIRLMGARETSDVTRLATSSGALILEADHAVLRIQDDETRRFVIRSYYGSADGRTQEKLFRLDKDVCVATIRSRQARLIRALDEAPETQAVAGTFRSALAAPLRRDGQVIGTLALYDKVSVDQFTTGAFGEEDLQVFSKYVSYVERALENARYYARTRQHRNFDEQTGLPNADYLDRRIDQELARAAGRSDALCLVSCQIENQDEIERAGGPNGSEAHVLRIADSLRAHLREFDVLGRTAQGEFVVLLPDPGPTPDERVTALARQVADDVSKDDRLNDPVRVALAFGYALHPGDGSDRNALLERARTPRIRMV